MQDLLAAYAAKGSVGDLAAGPRDHHVDGHDPVPGAFVASAGMRGLTVRGVAFVGSCPNAGTLRSAGPIALLERQSSRGAAPPAEDPRRRDK